MDRDAKRPTIPLTPRHSPAWRGCTSAHELDLGVASGGPEAVLPRKEVIQPHLPVRLPCYDFTPITNPTLDACLPKGLAQRLQVLPTFVV